MKAQYLKLIFVKTLGPEYHFILYDLTGSALKSRNGIPDIIFLHAFYDFFLNRLSRKRISKVIRPRIISSKGRNSLIILLVAIFLTKPWAE